MHDVIFVSMEDWDQIWRRNQFVVAELARRFPQQRVLFVGLNRDFSHAIRRGKLGALRSEKAVSVPEFPNVTLTNAPKFLPNSIPLCRFFNEWIVRRHVRKTAKMLGVKTPILWLNPHYGVHMCGKMGECGVVYDITDDWTHFTQAAAEKRLVTRQDAELCRRADAVIVCSQRLHEMKTRLARRLFLVQNGVDVAHYAPVAQTKKTPDAAPVFGYTGSIHADRVDVNRVLELARAFPQGRVLLIGPNMLPDETTVQLCAEPNIEVRGAVPYAQIAAAMSEFDVCIVPHVETAFTESLNPIKLWEYLAAGKPIVSTNVAGFRDYSQFCRIASGADFVAACREALAEARGENPEIDRDEATRARQNEAAKHSWTTRVDEIVAILDSLEK